MLKVTRTTVETVVGKNNNTIKYFKFDVKGFVDFEDAFDWIKAKENELELSCTNMYFNPDYSAKGFYGIHTTFSEPRAIDVIEEAGFDE